MKESLRIQELSNAFGPSGLEDDVLKIVQKEVKEIQLERDSFNNLSGVLNPKNHGPKIMFDAHMDEVGLIVQAVKPNGTMTFLPLGGQAASNFVSASYKLKNKKGEYVHAVVASKPPHFLSEIERNAAPQVSNLVLDCGSTSKEETEKEYALGIACFGVPDVECKFDEKKGLFYGKAFDDRIGVAAQIEVLNQLSKAKLPCQIQASFSTQEEVGERGVYANYKKLQPDVLICFEGCPADDTFQEPWLIQAGLHKGPMLRHFDVTMITNPRFQAFALDLAKKHHIPVQESVRSGGGTNAGRIHMEGVPSIVIGVPVRYIHSNYSYCALDDYQAAVQLGVTLAKHLTKEVIQQF
ncbi:MAG: M20/M25/M40 family metallo-hydrolase [Solobacterium sp.]|nr:M20/M25/M40 family metallo-hydrolase [Solobacterium sp.]